MKGIEKKSKKIFKAKEPGVKNRFSKRLVAKGNTIMCVGDNLIK